MKSVFIILMLFLFLPIAIHAHGEKEVKKVTKVVIDPGHGGKDGGAPGRKSNEKDLVLNIALVLGEQIKNSFPDVEVIYTRETDVFVPLKERAKIANEVHADFFISIHINANNSPRPYGAETYVMGLHKSADNLEVAKTENAAILMEDDYIQEYEGFDPNSDEAYILFSLYQNEFLDQSLYMATQIQDEFTSTVGFKNRGVKQAGFWVLYKTTMPGVLVEAGFISNPEEEKFLIQKKNQEKIASALFNAFSNYKKSMEGYNSYEAKNTDNNNNENTEIINKTFENNGENEKIVNEIIEEVCFKVQIGTSTKPKPLDPKNFKGLENVEAYFHNGLYKYTYGKEKTLSDAAKLQRKLQEQGFKDAFVIAFKGDERISPAKAVKLLKNNNN